MANANEIECDGIESGLLALLTPNGIAAQSNAEYLRRAVMAATWLLATVQDALSEGTQEEDLTYDDITASVRAGTRETPVRAGQAVIAASEYVTLLAKHAG